MGRRDFDRHECDNLKGAKGRRSNKSFQFMMIHPPPTPVVGETGGGSLELTRAPYPRYTRAIPALYPRGSGDGQNLSMRFPRARPSAENGHAVTPWLGVQKQNRKGRIHQPEQRIRTGQLCDCFPFEPPCYSSL